MNREVQPNKTVQNPTAGFKLNLLRLVQYGDGARALARFIVQITETQRMPSQFVVCELKRRERRAPLRPNCVTLIYEPQ